MTMQVVPIVVSLSNVDSHIYMLLLFLFVTGQGTMYVPLEQGYGAWKNKDKAQNGDHNDSDRKNTNCLDRYHKDNNTTENSRP
jgi:hypothetical protein